MKKNLLLLLVPALALVFFVSSCSKNEDNNNQANSTPQGTWSGTGQYGTSGSNPTYVFSVTFNANGTVNVVGNNSVAIDNATGTWQMVGDSVRAYYTYASSSANYALSAKYTAGANVMVGTIGLAAVTSGVGIFSITRQ